MRPYHAYRVTNCYLDTFSWRNCIGITEHYNIGLSLSNSVVAGSGKVENFIAAVCRYYRYPRKVLLPIAADTFIRLDTAR